MSIKVLSAAITGFESKTIEVEIESSYGLRSFDIVGLPDKAIQESKDRVAIATKNSGFVAPLSKPQKIIVSLAPADLKKEGSFYDLPIALAYLLQTKQINFDPKGKIFVGELSLNGEIKPAKGILALALSLDKNITQLIVPQANAQEAALAFVGRKDAPQIIGVNSLKQTINYLLEKEKIKTCIVQEKDFLNNNDFEVDFSWIQGQEFAKRAIQISAAGGHNLLMVGPPGGGKSLLAKSIPSILPPLETQEMIEVTKIYSLAGMLPENNPLISTRPFRSPHHTSSSSAIIGGGNPLRPGEITLSHRGVLFLDEFPEFHRDVLESLRQPLEDGHITISRARDRVTLPCRFILVAAANPTPGGFYQDQNEFYSGSQIAKYRRKLSGPLVDRIDLRVELPMVKYDKLIAPNKTGQSQQIRQSVVLARNIQKQRFINDKILLNSEMNPQQIKKYCAIDNQSENILRRFVDSGKLSARGFHKVLKVARTIADLQNSQKITSLHVSEALAYKTQINES